MVKPVGELLREKRIKKGYSARVVAEKLGIRTSYWYEIEYARGARLTQSKISFLEKICKVLDISLPELRESIAAHGNIHRIAQKETLADYVRSSRLEMELSQRELAARAEMSQVEISNIETGVVKWPQHATLGKLAVALDRDPEELLSRTTRRTWPKR